MQQTYLTQRLIKALTKWQQKHQTLGREFYCTEAQIYRALNHFSQNIFSLRYLDLGQLEEKTREMAKEIYENKNHALRPVMPFLVEQLPANLIF